MVPVKLQILFNELFVVKDSKMKIISTNQVIMQAVWPCSMIAPLKVHQMTKIIVFFISLVSRLAVQCNYVLSFLTKC